VIDAILDYRPVVALNGLAVIGFVAGYALFGIAMTRTASLPRLSGIFVALGAPAYLLGAGVAQLVSPAVWAVAVLGSASLGAGVAWPGYRLWQARDPNRGAWSPCAAAARSIAGVIVPF
jgi:hypothetical protein